MKIDLQSSYNIYRKNTAGAGSGRNVANSQFDTNKKDVDSISRGATSVGDSALVHLKAGIHEYVSSSVSPERLSQIREDVKAGRYHVATEDIVNSILG